MYLKMERTRQRHFKIFISLLRSKKLTRSEINKDVYLYEDKLHKRTHAIPYQLPHPGL